VYKVLALLVPLGVVTSTLAVPALPAGIVAVILVLLPTATFVAAAPAIVTPVAPPKSVPVMVTDCPPACGPDDGLMDVTVGAARYEYSAFWLLVPPGVVTSTLAVPALPAGVVAVMVVAFTTFTAVAAVPPIVTAVAPVKLVPVRVTDCPPASRPDGGLMDVTVGTA
jgi:hypothetical protein